MHDTSPCQHHVHDREILQIARTAIQAARDLADQQPRPSAGRTADYLAEILTILQGAVDGARAAAARGC